MGYLYLYCNIQNCRKELTTTLWVTSCFHAFCFEHGKLVTKHCPICKKSFTNPYDLLLQDVKSTENAKMRLLAGLHPDEILRMVSNFMKFWKMQDGYGRSMREEIARLDAKMECERQMESLKSKFDDQNKKLETLVAELAERSRALKTLQKKYDLLKEWIISNNRSSSPETYYRHFNKRFDSNSLNIPAGHIDNINYPYKRHLQNHNSGDIENIDSTINHEPDFADGFQFRPASFS